jgi:hypothetical protein
MEDARLLDCNTKAQIEANMIRILSMLDALETKIKAYEASKEVQK